MKKEMKKIDLGVTYKRLYTIKEIKSFFLETYREKDDMLCICAHVYPSDLAYKKMEGERGDGESDVAVYLYISDIIRRKCLWLPKYQKVEKVIMETTDVN